MLNSAPCSSSTDFKSSDPAHTSSTFPASSSSSESSQGISLVIAGVGRFLSSGLMRDEKNQTDFNPIEFSAIGSLIHPDHHNPRLADYASRCAPAVAVAALLLKRNLDHRSITA
jgi:hypothetical protein